MMRATKSGLDAHNLEGLLSFGAGYHEGEEAVF